MNQRNETRSGFDIGPAKRKTCKRVAAHDTRRTSRRPRRPTYLYSESSVERRRMDALCLSAFLMWNLFLPQTIASSGTV